MGIRSAKVKIYHVGRNKNESDEKSRLRCVGAYLGAGARLGDALSGARVCGCAGQEAQQLSAGELPGDQQRYADPDRGLRAQ